MSKPKDERHILWFKEIGIEDVPLVGGKSASLGEMYRNLTDKGINISNGFAVTAYAYRYFLKEAGIEDKIKEILSDLDTKDVFNLKTKGHQIRDLIRNASMPEDLVKEIYEAYWDLEEMYGLKRGQDYLDVAIRSSATAEDLPDASFAGQQDTFLNIRGAQNVVKMCQECFASLFTDRAISYRHDKGFGQLEVALSITVQKMVRSDAASSGVMFTIDTESGFKDVILVTAAYGLGENVVQGKVNPDEYYVFKTTLKQGKRPIIGKKLGEIDTKMVYSDDEKAPTKQIPTTLAEKQQYVLTDDEILELAKWGLIIEEHYGKAMDIEWAKDGDGVNVGTGKLFIVQARPETVHSIKKDSNVIETYVLKEEGKLLLTGMAVGTKIGTGEANVIETANEMDSFKPGQILVTDMTDPDWEPIMKEAAAIITNRGGRTCHAAIVSRELGIPCVIGTGNAVEVLKTGQPLTVSCARGEVGEIFEGILPYEIERLDVATIPKTRTKIMMNVGIPEQALIQAQIPNDGVGLAREEFIINSHIGIHPLALIEFEELKKKSIEDRKIATLISKIQKQTFMYRDKVQFFIDKLAEGIARIAAGFYPKDVIVRLSDFKSNEYANLLGGWLYEPEESNPMIGWRGASRYYDPKFEPAFALECKALKKVRDDMGLTNVKIMVPFCRTPEEGRKVINLMKKYGLVQGENGLEIYVMAEIPSNVISAEEFAEIFDGFSIGSNDLTQLTLGLDRDSDLISHIYDERNEAVKRLVKMVIDTAKNKGRKIGICGQAPSDFPDFAQFLVECGIDSISLIPDTVIRTKLEVAKKEKELGINPE